MMEWIESRIMTQLNITVTHFPIPQTRHTKVNGSWWPYTRMARKGGQPTEMMAVGKDYNPTKSKWGIC